MALETKLFMVLLMSLALTLTLKACDSMFSSTEIMSSKLMLFFFLLSELMSSNVRREKTSLVLSASCCLTTSLLPDSAITYLVSSVEYPTPGIITAELVPSLGFTMPQIFRVTPLSSRSLTKSLSSDMSFQTLYVSS